MTLIVDSVKTTVGNRIHPSDMVAVIREGFSRGQARGLSDDPVALDHEPGAIAVLDHPLATKECDSAIRAVLDQNVVNESVGLVRRQAKASVVVAQSLQASREAGKFMGAFDHTLEETPLSTSSKSAPSSRTKAFLLRRLGEGGT
jgi:hypothetical protein